MMPIETIVGMMFMAAGSLIAEILEKLKEGK
jgi:hypothetical protein